jgi:carbon monoxide dehydrogenase subunit G
VWEVLSDPRAVVSCIRGAEIVSQNEDGTYDGKLVVQFGPMRVGFGARVALELVETQMQGRIMARGKDQHGATRMSTEAHFEVLPGPNGQGSVVGLVGEVKLSGRLASQIEAGAGVVVKRMSGEFTESLTARFAPPGEPEAPGPAGPAAAVEAPAGLERTTGPRRWVAAIARWLRRPRLRRRR